MAEPDDCAAGAVRVRRRAHRAAGSGGPGGRVRGRRPGATVARARRGDGGSEGGGRRPGNLPFDRDRDRDRDSGREREKRAGCGRRTGLLVDQWRGW